MRTALVVFTAALVLAAPACAPPAGNKPPSPPPTPAAAPPADKPSEPAPVPPRVDGPVGDVVDAYDAMRLQLAHDDLAAAKSAAKIADAAKAAAADAKGATKQPLTDLAAHADAMAKAEDLPAARRAFSDVTKDVVALMVADPSLQTGRFLFMCPMAKGYQKWVQTSTKLENPFFGKSMIDCGEQLKAWAV